MLPPIQGYTWTMLLLALLQAVLEQDPRARAVREAYEEQLRADRPLLVLHYRTTIEGVPAAEGFDTLDHQGGMALLSLWIEGDQAYPQLVQGLDHSDLKIARSAARVLNLLTGRRAPLPEADTQDRLKADWEAWLRNPSPACGHADADVSRLIERLGAEEVDTRRDAERILASCAGRHADQLKQAEARTQDVEVRSRLRELIAVPDRKALRPADLKVLETAQFRLQTQYLEDGVALLRNERERFHGTHRDTLDVILAALQK